MFWWIFWYFQRIWVSCEDLSVFVYQTQRATNLQQPFPTFPHNWRSKERKFKGKNANGLRKKNVVKKVSEKMFRVMKKEAWERPERMENSSFCVGWGRGVSSRPVCAGIKKKKKKGAGHYPPLHSGSCQWSLNHAPVNTHTGLKSRTILTVTYHNRLSWMKKIVIKMRSYKKLINQDLLQLALIISLLKVKLLTLDIIKNKYF